MFSNTSNKNVQEPTNPENTDVAICFDHVYKTYKLFKNDRQRFLAFSGEGKSVNRLPIYMQIKILLSILKRARRLPF